VETVFVIPVEAGIQSFLFWNSAPRFRGYEFIRPLADESKRKGDVISLYLPQQILSKKNRFFRTIFIQEDLIMSNDTISRRRFIKDLAMAGGGDCNRNQGSQSSQTKAGWQAASGL